jgi:hypothetical protein
VRKETDVLLSEDPKLEPNATESTVYLTVSDIRRVVEWFKKNPPSINWARYQREIFEANHREK